MRKCKTLFCGVSFALVLFSFSIVKLNDPIELIIENLNEYAAYYGPNKVYVHTDRSTYALEDTVWFKTYMIDATHHLPSDDSKVVYVDLVNSNGIKVSGRKLYTEDMSAASDFFIERGWNPGRYKLRAYTKYMLNNDQEYIHNKEIRIVDINKATDEMGASGNSEMLTKISSPSLSLDLAFFPEGGDLLAGINSRIAIKIENYPAECGEVSGTIQDISGNDITPFKVYEKGYGFAAFKPIAGNTYFAKLDNSQKKYPLPEVNTQGYNIWTNNKSDKVSIIVSTNVTSGLSEGNILVHNRGQLIYLKKLDDQDIVDDTHGFSLNTIEMPTGVSHITFFDKDGIPRSERLFFIDNGLSQSIVKTDKSIYTRKEKVDLSLSVSTSNLEPFDCSVSVFEKSSQLANQLADNIKSWILLNSDLRGEINDPAFYFDKSRNPKKSFLLDLVMMTHGWRRFTWNDMREKSAYADLEYSKELGLYINGYTNKLLSKEKPIKSNVKLNFLNNSINEDTRTTGDDGRFQFGPFIIEDSITAVIQARKYNQKNKKDFVDGNRNLEINIDTLEDLNFKQPAFKEIIDLNDTAYKEFISSNKMVQVIKDDNHNMKVLLSEVVITAKEITEEDEVNKYIAGISYYGRPSNRKILEDQDRTGSISILDVLRRVPGLIIRGDLVIIQGPSSFNAAQPLFLIDGVPADFDVVELISPSNVWLVDVLKGPDATIFGARGAGGVVAIYTGRNPNSNITRRGPGIIDLVIKGFDKNRQFYAPDYSKNTSSVYGTDFRSTLYWNPNVTLTKDKENSISFFTSENIGDYVVAMEGISENGEPIFDTLEFSVKDN